MKREQQNKIHKIVESSCGEHHGYFERVCGMRHLERAGTGFGSVSDRFGSTSTHSTRLVCNNFSETQGSAAGRLIVRRVAVARGP